MNKILKFNKKNVHSKSYDITDEELVKMSVKGDCDAFGILIKRNKEYLYKTAFLYVKDQDKALDILQETIYIAFKNIKKLREYKYFKTWITRILINLAIKSLKKDSKVIQIESVNDVIDENIGIGIDEKVDLYNAVNELKEDFKDVVIMKYYNELSISQISDILGIPENTVKTKLSRARQMLKKILREDYLNE